MKSGFIALVCCGMAVTVTGFRGLAQGTNGAAAPRLIDPRAMWMQKAVLQDRNIREVEALLRQGADINAPIGCGTYGLLDGAVATGDLPMLKFLLAHGAKPRGGEMVAAAFADNRKTALEFARLLLAAGGDPNATNSNGGTAISSAAFQGNRDLLRFLLVQPGIKVDLPDNGGWTPLMYAADHGSVDIEDLLLKAGADSRRKNSLGETAADMAERSRATSKAVKPYVYVSGGVAKAGCYRWSPGMTALDAVRVAGGFKYSVAGPVLITHGDGKCEIWCYPSATDNATNGPPALSRDVAVYVRVE